MTNLIVDVADVRFGSAYSLQNADFEPTSGSDMVAIITSGSQPDANGWLSTNINASGRSFISMTNKTQFRVRFGTGR